MRTLDYLEKLLFCTAVLLLGTLICMVLSQTVLRNVLNFSFVEVEELSMLLLSWFTFISATYCLRRHGHVAVDYFYNKMPFRIRFTLNLLTLGAILALVCFIAYYGWQLSMRQMRMPLVVTGIKRGWMYLSAPVCAVLMAAIVLDAIVTCIRNGSAVGLTVDSNAEVLREIDAGAKAADQMLREFASEERDGGADAKGEDEK